MNGLLHLVAATSLLAKSQGTDQDRSSDGVGFQDTYYEVIDPILETNPQIGYVMTFVGIGVIIVQMFTLFGQYKKTGFRGWMVMLMGSTLLSTALIAPQTMIPFWLGLIDWVWGIILSVIGV